MHDKYHRYLPLRPAALARAQRTIVVNGFYLVVVVGFGLAIALPSRSTYGDTWPGWRGPGSRGVSPERNLPLTWSMDEHLVWQAEIPGWGNSSAAVTSDRVYMTTQTENRDLLVVALDRETAARLWTYRAGNGQIKAHKLHNMASPTPAADEKHVWALFGTGDLVCLDREGNRVWTRNLVDDYGNYQILWGMASSPVLYDGLLYFVCMHSGPSYVLALDKATGDVVWKVSRDFPCRGEATDSYTTPAVVDTDDRRELIVCGADRVNAYDLLTGRQRWISLGLGIDHPYGRIVASPAVSDRVVVACSANVPGFGKMIAIRQGGQGDVTETHRLWRYDKYTPDCPAPVCYEGAVYLVRDNGLASCLDEQTGELRWRKRLGKNDFKASPVAGDGKVYFLDTRGNCTVIRVGTEGQVLAQNKLKGVFISTPAISDGRLYLRAQRRIYAIGGPARVRQAF